MEPGNHSTAEPLMVGTVYHLAYFDPTRQASRELTGLLIGASADAYTFRCDHGLATVPNPDQWDGWRFLSAEAMPEGTALHAPSQHRPAVRT